MRYLNRIIFINSAHVPYTELKVDGNVHFIGTQGVGKSTLLRANLFFYNGDKSKLGIKTQAGQKGYDEFYLPYPNSYIIYEVVRETGTFFIMSFLSHGRTAFRIVDCPYEKRFFIDEHGDARYQWGQISEKIGAKVFKSNIIRSYEEYLNILYGNKDSVPRELRRFSLMESAKYRQLILAIQNIFLNQSLESRVIKDTIINSMDFPNDSINLDRYREEVKNFRQQYEDIWKWYREEPKGAYKGRVKVRVEAEAVIDRFSLYDYERRLITEYWSQMNFALERDGNRLPRLVELERSCGSQLERQQRLLGEESAKYKKEHDELTGRIAVIDAFLNDVKKKRAHYERVEIGKIIEATEKEEELNVLRQSLMRQIEVLTGKNEDIKTKYDKLIEGVRARMAALKVQTDRRLTDLERRLLEKEGHLQSEAAEKAEAIRSQAEVKLNETQSRLTETLGRRGDTKAEMQCVSLANPYREEFEQQEIRIKALRERQLVLSGETAKIQSEIDRIMGEVAMARKDIEIEADRKAAAIETEVRQKQTRIEQLDDMLSRQKGSLIEWLGENMKGWEESIGKVVDEDTILYNTSLNPRKSTDARGLYGLEIDLSGVEKTLMTPEALKEEKTAVENAVAQSRKEVVKAKAEAESMIAELERKPAARLKQLRIEKVGLEAEFNLIPQRIGNVEKERGASDEKLKKWRDLELDRLRNADAGLVREIEGLEKMVAELKAKRDKEIDAIRRTLEKRKKEAAAEIKTRREEEEDGLKRQEKEARQEERRLTAEMDAELKGKGVDLGRLNAIREQLRDVEGKLKYISDNQKTYFAWQNDTREYFNRETAKKDERRILRQKMDDMDEKFVRRKGKYNEEIEALMAQKRKLQDEQKALEEALAKARGFMAGPSCPENLRTEDRMETVKPLADILEELRDRIATLQRKLDEFKEAVGRFRSNFSPQNTFHFRLEFNTDADYSEFAAELNEFLSNNKIEQYRQRTSSQYAAIIKRIAKDVADLSQHKADIEKTILSVNRDFRENNFAGVIKEIELRAVESNDRLMQQLLHIKRFEDEHGEEVGEMNLFTTESSGRVNEQAVRLLMTLVELMDAELKRDRITLADTFKLEFKVKENDNDTNWVEKLSNVGSDGTDILVKAMVNIMLINVFKAKVSRKFGDFRLHCMMDEIGKLHPSNVEGILKFANVRNIYLINSSPTTYNAQAYKYTYTLEKDEHHNTVVKTLLTIK